MNDNDATAVRLLESQYVRSIIGEPEYVRVVEIFSCGIWHIEYAPETVVALTQGQKPMVLGTYHQGEWEALSDPNAWRR